MINMLAKLLGKLSVLSDLSHFFFPLKDSGRVGLSVNSEISQLAVVKGVNALISNDVLYIIVCKTFIGETP